MRQSTVSSTKGVTVNKTLTGVALVLLGLLAGCAGGVPDEASADGTHGAVTTPADPRAAVMAPEDPPLGLVPSSPEGDSVEVLPGLIVTVPEGAVVREPAVTDPSVETVTYRMDGAVDGLPALQIKSGTDLDIHAQTWLEEQSMTIDATITDIHRSVEDWPGAAQAVAFSWTSEVTTSSGPAKNDVATLWLVTDSGQFYSLMAVAREGTLQDSEVHEALLSAELADS